MKRRDRAALDSYEHALNVFRLAVKSGDSAAAITAAAEVKRVALATNEVIGPRVLFRRSTRQHIERRWDRVIADLQEGLGS